MRKAVKPGRLFSLRVGLYLVVCWLASYCATAVASVTENDASTYQTTQLNIDNLSVQLRKPALGLSEYPRVTRLTADSQRVIHNLGFHGASVTALCDRDGLGFIISCYAVTQRAEALTRLISYLQQGYMQPCSAANNQSNVWQFAMGLDQLKVDSQVDTKLIEARIEKGLRQCLNVLEDDSASLWHGRFSIASEAFITAAALNNTELLTQAFHHYSQSILALAMTEGWPESYNYWIQNRALTFYLGLQTYLHIGNNETLKEQLIQLARRNGLWHIYMTRPDFRVQPSGDEGSKSDLTDETKKVIDLITRITQDKVFATYAELLRKRQRNSGYHSSYQWLIPFTYDHDVTPKRFFSTGLDVFQGWLPNADVFGQGFLNHIVIREGWGELDAFLFISAGQQFTHHQHADAGHLTLFDQGQPVLVDGASYGAIHSDSRLYYGVRTTSKNVINLSSAETNYQPNRLFKRRVEDGSQRLILPTGSAITSIEDWQSQRYARAHYQRASILAFNHDDAKYEVSLDLTAAYFADVNSADISVRRHISFDPDKQLLIRDQLQGVQGYVASHWNLASDITMVQCVDGNTPVTVATDTELTMMITSSGERQCTNSFAQLLKEEMLIALQQIARTSYEKKWYDGAPKVIYWTQKADEFAQQEVVFILPDNKKSKVRQWRIRD